MKKRQTRNLRLAYNVSDVYSERRVAASIRGEHHRVDPVRVTLERLLQGSRGRTPERNCVIAGAAGYQLASKEDITA